MESWQTTVGMNHPKIDHNAFVPLLDAVSRVVYYKYFHPKEALVSNGILNRYQGLHDFLHYSISFPRKNSLEKLTKLQENLSQGRLTRTPLLCCRITHDTLKCLNLSCLPLLKVRVVRISLWMHTHCAETSHSCSFLRQYFVSPE